MAPKQSVPTVPLSNWRTCSTRNVLAAAGTVADTEPLNNSVDGLNQLPNAAGTLSKRKWCTHQEIQADALNNEAARQAKGGNALAGAGISAGAEPLNNTVDGLNQLSDAAGTLSRRKQCTPEKIQADVLIKEAVSQAKADVRAATAATKAAKANTHTAKSKKIIAQLTLLHKPVNVPIQTPHPTDDVFLLHEACWHSWAGSLFIVENESPMVVDNLRRAAESLTDNEDVQTKEEAKMLKKDKAKKPEKKMKTAARASEHTAQGKAKKNGLTLEATGPAMSEVEFVKPIKKSKEKGKEVKDLTPEVEVIKLKRKFKKTKD